MMPKATLADQLCSANGALIMGGTIWSMHFIAMMAVDSPIVVNYNLIETIASICIAITRPAIGLISPAHTSLETGASPLAACSWVSA
jgi:NO-binding membrane sensor protein with MHYT domain